MDYNSVEIFVEDTRPHCHIDLSVGHSVIREGVLSLQKTSQWRRLIVTHPLLSYLCGV